MKDFQKIIDIGTDLYDIIIYTVIALLEIIWEVCPISRFQQFPHGKMKFSHGVLFDLGEMYIKPSTCTNFHQDVSVFSTEVNKTSIFCATCGENIIIYYLGPVFYSFSLQKLLV